MNWLFGLVALIILILLVCIYYFNRLVMLTNRTNEAWADIDVQLKRRYDLIPKLVEVVKGYVTHEKQLIEDVTELRVEAVSAKSIHDKEGKEGALTNSLSNLFAVAENYPDLKANENFIQLQKDLVNTEDIIARARRFYNGNVRELNITIESFPGNLFASLFHYSKKEFYQVNEDEKQDIQV